MDKVSNGIVALFYTAMFIGGIICVINGIEVGNHGAPIAGAILMVASIHFGLRTNWK